MTKLKPNTSIHQARLNAEQARLAAQAQHAELPDAPERGVKLRVLPMVMVAAGLFLGFKLATIYDQSHYITGLFGSQSAVAQVDQNADAGPDAGANTGQNANEAANDPQAGSGANSGADPTAGPQLGEGRSLMDSVTGQPPAEPEPEAPRGSDGFDPTKLTQSEVDLLQSLAERRDMIEQREAELSLNEALLQATEQRVDEKIAELKRMENTVRSLIEKLDENDERELKRLVKIYETMKPKKAAAIFETLDLPILLDVAERMKEAKLALILQQVSAARAQEVTTELRSRYRLPGEVVGQ